MWPNPQETAGLVTITEEIVNGNIFCAVSDIGCGLHFQIYTEALAAWKASKYGVISGPYFSTFGLNTERYFVSLRIQSECGKIRTRNNSVFGHFSRSDSLSLLFLPHPLLLSNMPYIHNLLDVVLMLLFSPKSLLLDMSVWCFLICFSEVLLVSSRYFR